MTRDPPQWGEKEGGTITLRSLSGDSKGAAKGHEYSVSADAWASSDQGCVDMTRPVALEMENPVTCLIEDVAPVVALSEEVGCGQAAHDEACLCDVDITRPLPIPHIQLRDMYLGREVLEHLRLCIPFTPAKLLAFFETQAAWKDVTAAPYVEVAPDHPSARGSKLPAPLRQFVGEQAMAGTPSPIIRAEVSRLYGIHISPSHMSQMRKRLVRQGGNL